MNRRIRAAFDLLGIDPALPRRRGLRAYAEARQLTCAGLGPDGRDKFLAPRAAAAWQRMQRRAAADGIALQLVSGFRSYDFQVSLVRAKLSKGMAVGDVLKVNAPPGYSEHHSGRAVDVGTPGCGLLEEDFELTDAFRWLQARAGRFGFSLSYPRDNPQGFLYEPWHWCHHDR